MPRQTLKNSLRRILKKKRADVSESERAQWNRAIEKRLEEDPLFQSARTVLFYVSTPQEVDTHRLIQNHLATKTVVLPTVDLTQKENRQLTLHPLHAWKELTEGAYGIPEINSKKKEKWNGPIDLILVPGVGFDLEGHRIGYGKGYYDRLLAEHPTVPTIGLAYDIQLVKKLPKEDHDIRLTHILTESQTLTP